MACYTSLTHKPYEVQYCYENIHKKNDCLLTCIKRLHDCRSLPLQASPKHLSVHPSAIPRKLPDPEYDKLAQRKIISVSIVSSDVKNGRRKSQKCLKKLSFKWFNNPKASRAPWRIWYFMKIESYFFQRRNAYNR